MGYFLEEGVGGDGFCDCGRNIIFGTACGDVYCELRHLFKIAEELF
jgi:hypothetical protein